MNEYPSIVVTGATGFVGRALVLRLLGEGHAVTALVRAPQRARDLLPAGVSIVSLDDDRALRAAVAEADAVVNLAGENVAGGRWTAARRRALRASRIEVTRRVVDAIASRFVRLPVLVSASAIGWYGDRGDDELVESAPPGTGFLAELCRDWEAAAVAASEHVDRVVRLRIGAVLGLEGGMLGTLVPVFRRGLGGRLGHGRQWLSWIHLEDAVDGILRAITDRGLTGPVNLVAPEPVRQRDFARALAGALGRRANLPVPRVALAVALGKAATVALTSQRVVPAALVRRGFAFRHPTLAGALADLIGGDGVTIRAATPDTLPDAPYLLARRPRYTLATRTVIDAPLADVFGFFSAAENLAAITPPALGFTIRTPRPVTLGLGATIDYRIRVSGLPLGWRTTIEAWEPGVRFVDSQARGPYRAWWHEHHFLADGGRTIMDDVIHYAAPLGPLGRLANGYVAGMLRRIFAYRSQAIRARFPARAQAAMAMPITAVPAPGPVTTASTGQAG